MIIKTKICLHVYVLINTPVYIYLFIETIYDARELAFCQELLPQLLS